MVCTSPGVGRCMVHPAEVWSLETKAPTAGEGTYPKDKLLSVYATYIKDYTV